MEHKKFHLIYDDVMSLWPKAINVKHKVIYDNGGMNSEDLVEAHKHVERRLEEKISLFLHENVLCDWYRLVDWAIYQVLHEYIRESKEDIVNPFEIVSEDIILNRCLENKEFSSDWVG